jgi:hypothetical protein
MDLEKPNGSKRLKGTGCGIVLKEGYCDDAIGENRD